MELFKREWTPEQADRWTVHDFFASLFGAVAFILVTVGIIGAFLLKFWGFLALGASLVLSLLMFRIIDPKLRAMSDAFELKQAEYLEDLEKKVRWEAKDGD